MSGKKWPKSDTRKRRQHCADACVIQRVRIGQQCRQSLFLRTDSAARSPAARAPSTNPGLSSDASDTANHTRPPIWGCLKTDGPISGWPEGCDMSSSVTICGFVAQSCSARLTGRAADWPKHSVSCSRVARLRPSGSLRRTSGGHPTKPNIAAGAPSIPV